MKKFNPPWKIAPVERKVQEGRKKANSKFYKTYKWQKHRKLFLQTNSLCVECLKKGRVIPAKVVDHITPINQGGDPWIYDNLQPMCSSCHNKKSGRERWQTNKK